MARLFNKEILRKVIFNLLYYLGIGHLLFLINKLRGRVPILLFHRIDPKADEFWQPIHPKDFEAIILLLRKKYHFISLDDLLQNKSIKANSCCIVFDDGFTDFYQFALPILEKYSIPTTVFLATSCTEKGDLIWTSQLNDILRKSIGKQLDVEIDTQVHSFRLDTPKEREKASMVIQKKLTAIDNESRKEILSNLEKRIGMEKSLTMMNWNEVAETGNRINYESHTKTHPYLPSIKSEVNLEREFLDSKEKLRTHGIQTKYISYPIGGYNSKCIKYAKKHYQAAFAVDNKMVNLKTLRSNGDYIYKIPRFNITDSNPKELFLRINEFHKMLGK